MKIVTPDRERSGSARVVFLKDRRESRLRQEGKQLVLEIPVKEPAKVTRRRWLILVRQIVQDAKRHQLKHLSLSWEEVATFSFLKKENPETLAQLLAENALLAAYEFRRYKKKPKEGWNDVETLSLFVSGPSKAVVERGLRRGRIIAGEINFCRDLANTPGNDMTPKKMVAALRQRLRGSRLKLAVWGEKELRTKGFGGVLAVGQGSKEESQFLILRHDGGKRGEAPVVLVGKGVTFDSGGIDTKPHPHALEMMMDMSGGAAVLTTLLIAEKIGLKKNLIALVPAVENMPSGESFRPGDVIKMLDGTHVEIGHTDAEGRLILADAITYATRLKPRAIISVATLTGAALVALGGRATALFSRNDRLAEQAVEAGEASGDYGWRLPLWEEYEAEIAGTIGDISNIRTKGSDGGGGAITAATFLKHFAKEEENFLHMDMAPTMTSMFDEQLAKGAKGSPVRLLIRLMEHL